MDTEIIHYETTAKYEYIISCWPVSEIFNHIQEEDYNSFTFAKMCHNRRIIY